MTGGERVGGGRVGGDGAAGDGAAGDGATDGERVGADGAASHRVGDRVDLARRAIGLIDLTDLADDKSADGIDELCRRAAEHGTAAVCVWPVHVARCVELLDASAVRVATVVNFPSGDEPIDVVVAETRAAIDDGADEIDVVIPYHALVRGDAGPVGDVVRSVASVLDGAGLLKVILETGALPTDVLVRSAATIAIQNGADFLKTSTGKIDVGATPQAARVMLTAIAEVGGVGPAGRTLGIKPSGGVRSLADVATYVDLAEGVMGVGWVTPSTFRVGASGLLDVLLDVIGVGDR